LKTELEEGKGVGVAVDGLHTPKLAQCKNRQVDRSLGIEIGLIDHELAEQALCSAQQAVSVRTDALDDRARIRAIVNFQRAEIRGALGTGGREEPLSRLSSRAEMGAFSGHRRVAPHCLPDDSQDVRAITQRNARVPVEPRDAKMAIQ
jgi:hypothetical protein